jgi:hypothetical protein
MKLQSPSQQIDRIEARLIIGLVWNEPGLLRDLRYCKAGEGKKKSDRKTNVFDRTTPCKSPAALCAKVDSELFPNSDLSKGSIFA